MSEFSPLWGGNKGCGACDDEEQEKAGQHGEKARGEHGALVAGPLQAKADHPIGNPYRGQGDQQISRLNEQIRHAVLPGGENPGIKRRQKKGEKFGPKGADAKQRGIGHKLLVGVQKQILR